MFKVKKYEEEYIKKKLKINDSYLGGVIGHINFYSVKNAFEFNEFQKLAITLRKKNKKFLKFKKRDKELITYLDFKYEKSSNQKYEYNESKKSK